MDNENLYIQMGEYSGIEKLVHAFYQYMDQLPEVKTIRDMHPLNLVSSIQKLTEFLSGWSGGPSLYIQKYGHPRLRARHLPFKITELEKDQWLYCMFKALEDQTEYSENLKTELKKSFHHIAQFMVNTPS